LPHSVAIPCPRDSFERSSSRQILNGSQQIAPLSLVGADFGVVVRFVVGHVTLFGICVVASVVLAVLCVFLRVLFVLHGVLCVVLDVLSQSAASSPPARPRLCVTASNDVITSALHSGSWGFRERRHGREPHRRHRPT